MQFVDNRRKKIYNFGERGPVAQLGERSVRIRKVMGSNPTGSTKNKVRAVRHGLCYLCGI